MRFIGVHFGHDSAIVNINEDGEVEFYAQCERYKREKNYGGFDYDLEKPALSCLSKHFPNLGSVNEDDCCVLVSIGGRTVSNEEIWTTIGNKTTKDMGCDPKLVRSYDPVKKENFMYWTLGRNPDMIIDHHFAHAVSAWCFRPDDEERLFMAYDGVGLDAQGFPKSSLVGEISKNGFKRYEDAFSIPTSCCLTSFLGYNSAGKAMGIAGYVTEESNIGCEEFLKKTVKFGMNHFTYTPQYLSIPDHKNITKEDMAYVAQFYKWYTNDIIWPAIESNIQKFAKGRGVVIGGGTTLALELNTRIHGMVKDVVFGPPTDDSGLALGAAAWAYFNHTGRWPKLNSPSLNALPSPLPQYGPQNQKDIAKRLANGVVIALLRGQAEAGPRALGFRSFLASAKNKNNLKRLSKRIKKREFYRPLAPIVTEEQFDRFFVGPKGKYMQYKVECTDEARRLLPAIVHKDGSARPQVVYKSDDPWLHKLLTDYGEISGVECLINTSLNGKNKPICNTFYDVMQDLDSKLRYRENIEVVSIGEKPFMFV